MCELQVNLRPDNEVAYLRNFMDEKWTNISMQKGSPRVIKIDPQSGPVGTVVTVRLDSTLLGHFIPKLVFHDLLMETKCIQSEGMTRLMAAVPDQTTIPASVPLYLYLLMDEGVVMTWHLTDFMVVDNGPRVDLGAFYQFPPMDRYEGYEPRSRSISDPYDTGGFTNLLCTNFDTSTFYPRAIQQHPYANMIPSRTYSHRSGQYASTSCEVPPHLVLVGDLDRMTENWTTEEQYNQRRLVQFNCIRAHHQEIRCTFQATTMKASGGAIVSCIYWAEHRDWYITSVDCLLLLEYVMEVRFTVDEKNRVRRNLEGFHPVTVSKTKADSAGFFKRIMAYTNPKPRNIEKDLKVFVWHALPLALKKMMTKYAGRPHKMRRASAPSGSSSQPMDI